MILLDSCTLLWLAADQRRLSTEAVRHIGEQAGFLFASAITAFEIGLKQRKGLLTLPMPAERYYREALASHGIREVPVDGVIAARSTVLPPLHEDPADRILVATAQRFSLTLLTPDPHIRSYPQTHVVW